MNLPGEEIGGDRLFTRRPRRICRSEISTSRYFGAPRHNTAGSVALPPPISHAYIRSAILQATIFRPRLDTSGPGDRMFSASSFSPGAVMIAGESHIILALGAIRRASPRRTSRYCPSAWAAGGADRRRYFGTPWFALRAAYKLQAESIIGIAPHQNPTRLKNTPAKRPID